MSLHHAQEPSSWERAFDNEETLSEIDSFCAVSEISPGALPGACLHLQPPRAFPRPPLPADSVVNSIGRSCS